MEGCTIDDIDQMLAMSLALDAKSLVVSVEVTTRWKKKPTFLFTTS